MMCGSWWSKQIGQFFISAFIAFGVCISACAEIRLESQVEISDGALHFDGKKITHGTIADADKDSEKYDYFFGTKISAHGDSVKRYKDYVFLTWYRGGKFNRQVMLSRYNIKTGSVVDIEFPHQHTGFRGNIYVGESHNTIAVAISPIDGTIHMVYDMHAYSATFPSDGSFANDYFRYSYSVAGAAEVPDEEFSLDKFVKDTSSISEGPDDYKHLTMTGGINANQFARLTYPTFFTNDEGRLLLYMRRGGNDNGAYVFSRYDSTTKTWSSFTQFNVLSAKRHGSEYNWGLYGSMKYVNGKLRVGFQQRASIKSDKYRYQNGIYYAYSDHPDGFSDWKNHRGEAFDIPLALSDKVKIYEPGDLISQTGKDQVYIVGGFDWTVTEKGDIHIISEVRTTDRSERVKLHSYKPVGAEEFQHSIDFAGASNIYTSGDNIYIIGLTSRGYPFVEKALGGTNNFVRVYEATSGTRFRHGRVHISEGKLYYYLMERASGASQPLHLQIIDLDIDGDDGQVVARPNVHFSQPVQSVEESYENLVVQVQANTPGSSGNIAGVKLYVNDVLIREDTNAPFVWGSGDNAGELLNIPAGRNIIKAVAVDDKGVENSATMILHVRATAMASLRFPQDSMSVYEGYDKLSFKVFETIPNDSIELLGVKLYANGRFIREDKQSPFVWGHKNKPTELLGLPVGENTFTAVATDNNGNEITATMTLQVKEVPPPLVSFNLPKVTKAVGYEQFNLSLTAESPASHVSIAGVELYINDNFIREDTAAPFVWGHNNKPEELLGLPAGHHIIKAIARDSGGRQSSASIDFIVKPKIISVDSEREPHLASNIFDGDSSDESRWVADSEGKRVVRMVLDLGETLNLHATKLWVSQGQKLRYQVYVGDFPDRAFKKVVNDTKKAKAPYTVEQPMVENFDARGRYVKLMIHGLADGSKAWAGISELEIISSLD